MSTLYYIDDKDIIIVEDGKEEVWHIYTWKILRNDLKTFSLWKRAAMTIQAGFRCYAQRRSLSASMSTCQINHDCYISRSRGTTDMTFYHRNLSRIRKVHSSANIIQRWCYQHCTPCVACHDIETCISLNYRIFRTYQERWNAGAQDNCGGDYCFRCGRLIR